ncbi:MAG: guanylate kinase [Coriobacteriia bacterium]|nr:guanylate kinase [Coriobacteriia bacterium]
MRKGTLFVISGPSGAGKGTLVSMLTKSLDSIGLSVSATTRSPRPGEVDGVAYFFLSNEQFDEELAQDGFLEWASVHGNRYGTLIREAERTLAEGKDLILEIDVQGQAQIKQRYPDAVSIFIEPPSLSALEQRIRARGADSEESLQKRLEAARMELVAKERYTVLITNDDLETAAQQLIEVVMSYRD